MDNGKKGNGGVSRRAVLGGVAGAAGVWVAPAVTVVSMDSASAASAPPPEHVSGQVPSPQSAGAPQGPTPSALAFTGDDLAAPTAIGAATAAAGVAAILVARKLGKAASDDR